MSISPWRDLTTFREEMFRNFLSGFNDSGPRFDIYQSGNEIIANIELPGLASKDDVEITATEDTLSVRGEVRRNEQTEEHNYHRTERYYGNFARTVTLPVKVQPEKAHATYKNGILDIRIPMAANQQQRRIPIELN